MTLSHDTGTVQKGGETLDNSPEEIATLQGEIEALKLKLQIAESKCQVKDLELEELRPEKYRKNATKTLSEAAALVMATLEGKHYGHRKHVEQDIGRFVKRFGQHTRCGDMQGQESEISAWIASIKKRDGAQLGPNARQYFRIYILKLLRSGGAKIDASQIQRITKKELKAKRGDIRYLTPEQAQQILERLPPYFADAFRLQCRVGFRPFELLTITKENFAADFSQLTLAPLGKLTLKTGSRTVPIPEDLRAMIQGRLAECSILFPEPAGRKPKRDYAPMDESKRKRKKRIAPAPGGQPWRDPDAFAFKFNSALTRAAVDANISVRMDCRIGRRTCATALIRANFTADRIAGLLGNSAAQVLESYADCDTENMPLTATEIGIKKIVS